ncbi:MAG: putative quinol monooxygenase [Planctomycetota bacterium]
MIHVIATLKVDPARRAEFLTAFRELTPKVLAEEGCLQYVAATDTPTSIAAQQLAGEDTVMVVEKWSSVAALEAHLDAPHMHAFREQSAEMTRGVTLQVLKPFE